MDGNGTTTRVARSATVVGEGFVKRRMRSTDMKKKNKNDDVISEGKNESKKKGALSWLLMYHLKRIKRIWMALKWIEKGKVIRGDRTTFYASNKQFSSRKTERKKKFEGRVTTSKIDSKNAVLRKKRRAKKFDMCVYICT